MKTFDSNTQGRYLLYLDLLGFSEIVKTKSARDVYDIIDGALKTFTQWEDLNGSFKVLYFSDTFILYQEPKGYEACAFLDVYAIGSMVLSALLASGIPARGSITFGEFEVDFDSTGRHQVYFGGALIEAYKAEQCEKWIGITIMPSAWKPYEAENSGCIGRLSEEGVWLKRNDDVLLLNPFMKLRRWHLTEEVVKPYSRWDAPEFPNDILGFKFLRDQAAAFSAQNDFGGSMAIKYHATVLFLKAVLGDDLYRWGEQAALPGNF